MLREIGILREIAECCETGAPLSKEAATWLATCLDSFLTQKTPTIEAAMGLNFARGGVPWWKEEAIRQRDRALRDLAEAYFDGMGPTRTAEAVHTMPVRYGASAWRFDRNSDRLPPSYQGTAKEHLWWAFSSGAAMPISQRQLRNILG